MSSWQAGINKVKTTDAIVRAYRVLEGETLSVIEAEELINTPPKYAMDLYSLAHKTRLLFSRTFALCSITNAKSGACPEDCRFCAQSAHNESCGNEFPLKDADTVIGEAKTAKKAGAQAFSIVTSGLGYTEVNEEFARITDIVRRIIDEVGIDVHVSLGILSAATIRALAEAGVSVIHHNIETAPSFFPSICSTHSIDDRIATICLAKEMGMRVCAGGIFGLGETPAMRVEFAATLRNLNVDIIPLNVLTKVEGTRVSEDAIPTPYEVLNAVAVTRLLNPKKVIKIAAGRETALADYQGLLFHAGANGMLIGGYLTIRGRSVAQDKVLINSLFS